MFDDKLFLIVIACIIVLPIVFIVNRILQNPFKYPYFTYAFDVSGKRNVKSEDYIDNFLRDDMNWKSVIFHQNKIEDWKQQCENYIQLCRLPKYRQHQYERILDDMQAYSFRFIRLQTRYKQINYVKTSYKVAVVDAEKSVDWQWLYNRRRELEQIGLEATLREYNCKNQRRLMTPFLRREIMERDDYTCQICRKYMPDEVGLHIDHIVPIAKGGKSVPSNLRVLCSKCNGSKGAK